jgi:hypothetical protein
MVSYGFFSGVYIKRKKHIKGLAGGYLTVTQL